MELIFNNKRSLYALAIAGCIVGGVASLTSIISPRDHKQLNIKTHNEHNAASSHFSSHNDDDMAVVLPINTLASAHTDVSIPPVEEANNHIDIPMRVHTPLVVDTPNFVPSINNGIEFPTEKKCRSIIEEYFQAAFPKDSRFCRNPTTNAYLELDGHNETLKIAFEYQGEQHYDINHNYWKTKRQYHDQKFRDRIKKVVCIRRNIRLIVIPCTAKNKKLGGIEKVLGDYLKVTFPNRL